MVTLSRSETKNMYSWWWDSHISPKNSKWLKENLTDMDSQVKSMIKIIEVDQDTFAKRAEVYYKKRPELMKLVEEFYRAYRALAERYDHATGVIREAHTTMAEAFPNQVPFLMHDDCPVNSTHHSGPRTPEMQAPIRAISGLDELLKGSVGLSSFDGNFTNRPDSVASRKESKQLNGPGKARKGLNFHGIEENQTQAQVLSESERLGRSETDIQDLKDSLAKLEAEKETGLLEYHKTVERLSKLESDFSQAKGDSQGLYERAIKAETQVESLKEFLAKVEREREASLMQYREFLDKIANLESQISRAKEDENVAVVLREELSGFKVEKEALLAKYMESLEKLANLENELSLSEDYASRITERAERAEKEADALKQSITRLTKEKNVAVLKYETSLEKIATLEHEIILIQEETEKLKADVEDGVFKINESERANKSLHSEVRSLEEKVGFQNQELSEKNKELGRLWTCVQEERMRFLDTEKGFLSLQNLHLKVQEELKSVANELQKKVQHLKELENQKKKLEDEVQKVKDENTSMGEEILGLKDGKEKVEQELEIQLDQRNALQLEIYSLKRELHSLSQRHQHLSRQVELVGFDPESIGSSVKELQDENSKLKESCQKSTCEISDLVERLRLMEILVQKNEVLENSLSNLGAELEGARGKVNELEESCKLLMGDKSTLTTEKGSLISQLQMTTENLEKLSQRNSRLENSLFDVNAELEMLRLKSRNLEESCMVLNDRNSALSNEKEMLACELDLTHNRLVDLGKIHVDLEERYSVLEEDRKSILQKVEVLQIYLAAEKKEHADSKMLSQTQIADLENQIQHLQEEGDNMREELEEELDDAVNAQFEIFILRKCIQDLKENNFSLLRYCEKLLDASRLSEKLISQLEKESDFQNDEVNGLRTGIFQLLDTLEAEIEPSDDCYSNDDNKFIDLIRVKLDDIKFSLNGALDENQELVIQKSVLIEVIRQLKENVSDLNSVVHAFTKEIRSRSTEVLLQQNETQKLLENNEELILKVREGNMKEAILLTEVEKLQEKLFQLQKGYDDLQNENFMAVEGNKSLIFTIEDLKEEMRHLEDERSCLIREVVELDNFSFIFKNIISENSKNVMVLTQTIEKLCSENYILEEKVKIIERNLKDARTKNLSFELSLKKSENEIQKGKDKVKLWETVAGSFFSEIQSSSLRESLLKEKLSELIEAYEALEDESYSKCMDIDRLRDRVGTLEGENSEIKIRLAAELSAIISLKDSVASLEKHVMSFKKNRHVDDGEKEDFEDGPKSNESQSSEFNDFHKVQARIQDVEKAVIELKQHSEEENSSVRSALASALKQIDALKSQRSLRRSGRLSRRTSHSEEELVMKDIVLDQASDCSSPYAKDRKVKEFNDPAFEVCEIVDRLANIDLKVVKPNGSATPSMDSMVERELGVDEQSSSRKFRNSIVDDSKKILERMASDVQKLTNLQITVRDLKEKLEMFESSSSSKAKAVERDNAKERLEESEQIISKLFDYSSKVMKNIENSSSASSSMSSISFDEIPAVDSSDRVARRKKSMDQARRISEKIGRLQMEIQKIQFFLMKLDNNSSSSSKLTKGGTRVAERSTRVLLRDYLYGGSRTPRRRKTSHFCGFVQPDTKG